MWEAIKDIVLTLVLVMVCAIGAYIIKSYKQRILEVITDLVQKAENAVKGSGMGTEKKAKVIAQLEAMGIKATVWVSDAIDKIVAYLNKKSGWLASSAVDTAQDALESATSSE